MMGLADLLLEAKQIQKDVEQSDGEDLQVLVHMSRDVEQKIHRRLLRGERLLNLVLDYAFRNIPRTIYLRKKNNNNRSNNNNSRRQKYATPSAFVAARKVQTFLEAAEHFYGQEIYGIYADVPQGEGYISGFPSFFPGRKNSSYLAVPLEEDLLLVHQDFFNSMTTQVSLTPRRACWQRPYYFSGKMTERVIVMGNQEI